VKRDFNNLFDLGSDRIRHCHLSRSAFWTATDTESTEIRKHSVHGPGLRREGKLVN